MTRFSHTYDTLRNANHREPIAQDFGTDADWEYGLVQQAVAAQMNVMARRARRAGPRPGRRRRIRRVM